MLVLDYLLGDIILVGKGGDSAEDLARRYRVCRVLGDMSVHQFHHLSNLS